MSLAVEGVPVFSVAFCRQPRTLISSGLYFRLNRPDGRSSVLVTTNIPGFLIASTLIECQADVNLSHDVVLGLDWAAYVRESLLNARYPLGDTFDAWLFFSHPDHPISRTVPCEFIPRLRIRVDLHNSVTSAGSASTISHPTTGSSSSHPTHNGGTPPVPVCSIFRVWAFAREPALI
ncbi:hypothetical protein C8F04DRAFT_1407125 [Mycena alexandri]|uniref:Uncharacterized protein n=1 Tax=Mycena alexandri TaxID=1745969 RepID=A0AAD6RW70_9AGAR|nr:hypothetical protein C8F04DRAFT_1407125 [Mycena alexandri]